VPTILEVLEGLEIVKSIYHKKLYSMYRSILDPRATTILLPIFPLWHPIEVTHNWPNCHKHLLITIHTMQPCNQIILYTIYTYTIVKKCLSQCEQLAPFPVNYSILRLNISIVYMLYLFIQQ